MLKKAGRTLEFDIVSNPEFLSFRNITPATSSFAPPLSRDFFRVGFGPFADGADLFHQGLDHVRMFFGGPAVVIAGLAAHVDHAVDREIRECPAPCPHAIRR